MKRKLKAFITLLAAAVLSACMLFGCTKTVQIDGDFVVITAQEVAENTTVLGYMQQLEADGELSFEYADSDYGAYITSINGVANDNDSYWMLYTSDAEYATTEYTAVYDGKTYGQATLGASTLLVKEGESYIWYYQTF